MSRRTEGQRMPQVTASTPGTNGRPPALGPKGILVCVAGLCVGAGVAFVAAWIVLQAVWTKPHTSNPLLVYLLVTFVLCAGILLGVLNSLRRSRLLWLFLLSAAVGCIMAGFSMSVMFNQIMGK